MLLLEDLMDICVSAATVERMENDGEVIQLARRRYQLPDAESDANHSQAGAAKRYPKCAICLVFAFAFHEIADRPPTNIWMAIGRNG